MIAAPINTAFLGSAVAAGGGSLNIPAAYAGNALAVTGSQPDPNVHAVLIQWDGEDNAQPAQYSGNFTGHLLDATTGARRGTFSGNLVVGPFQVSVTPTPAATGTHSFVAVMGHIGPNGWRHGTSAPFQYTVQSVYQTMTIANIVGTQPTYGAWPVQIDFDVLDPLPAGGNFTVHLTSTGGTSGSASIQIAPTTALTSHYSVTITPFQTTPALYSFGIIVYFSNYDPTIYAGSQAGWVEGAGFNAVLGPLYTGGSVQSSGGALYIDLGYESFNGLSYIGYESIALAAAATPTDYVSKQVGNLGLRVGSEVVTSSLYKPFYKLRDSGVVGVAPRNLFAPGIPQLGGYVFSLTPPPAP